MPRILLFLALLIFFAQPAASREAGWVPIPKEPYKPQFNSGVPPAKKQVRRQPAPVRASQAPDGETVYDRQPLVTENELADFIALLPQFRSWARQNHEDAHPVVNAAGKPDFKYSRAAADWVAAHGFSPARFFCVMGRMAAGVVIIEEGNDLKGALPADMPTVDKREIALARRHLGELLTAAAGK
ncbi:MAG: hypothetical protein HDQ44_03555 [Desulfovibrio sp.]|nr:hypothetical protein [Desulfovibrio sp.]